MLDFPQPDVEQFFQTYGIETFAISPDESQLVFSTNLNGKYNLWAMDLPHTFPYPLTFHNQSCEHITYDPKGEFIIVVVDEDGDENGQIYAVPPQGGTLQPVRKKEGARHILPFISDNGKQLYYTSTKDDETFMKGYRYNLDTDEEEVIVHGEGGMTILVDKSPEEKSFLYMKGFSNTYQLFYVKTEEEELLLTPSPEPQHTVTEAVFVSEQEIYLLTNYESDFSYLARFNLETKDFEKVAHVESEDFKQIKYDQTTESLYIISEKGVRDQLYRFKLDGDKLEELESPVGVIDQLVIAASGTVYLRGDSETVPANLYKQSEKGWEPLTKYGVPGVKDEYLIAPDYVTYESFDGLEIEALLYRPKPERDNGHMILWPHGGPQAAERASFRSLFLFLVHEGYSLFAPNFRGSTGYGQKFAKMIEGDWGHAPRIDNVAGLDWLIDEGYATKDRILLMGGSYGGYMALLLHGRHPEYFKAVVDIFGPCNLFSFIDSVPEHWKPAIAQFVGDPEKDKEKLEEDSPINYLDTMTKPMLVIQGAKDPRVVKAESDQVVEALKKKGRDVDYIVLEDEGHGFSKKENEILVYRKVLDFLQRYTQ
ncbi:prolyl oligopeptidase family serine peptidase [Halobacillus litoralis]|uniref:Prolyl oligopeptidase family serine peptidase n=1 Tax=Halobacillus litoralis TaxID=45668 RepID=A0A845FBS7_9BACI|nr:S9 family peptidase [Halobacillus litoralis]MYL71390.1 prolyl oligopeptidase family serine peptidase [Halobacillus litoralis]